MPTERRHHTRHGLHLNKKGRDWVVNNVIKEIRNWKLSRRESSPIELPWKNEMNDTGNQVGKEGPSPNCKNDGHPESGASAAEVDSLSQTDEECLRQTKNVDQQDKITLRKSNRLKQLPPSKYQDFLLQEGYKLKKNYVSNNKCEKNVSGASDNSEYLDETYSITNANDCSENTLLSDSNISTTNQKLSTEVPPKSKSKTKLSPQLKDSVPLFTTKIYEV